MSAYYRFGHVITRLGAFLSTTIRDSASSWRRRIRVVRYWTRRTVGRLSFLIAACWSVAFVVRPFAPTTNLIWLGPAIVLLVFGASALAAVQIRNWTRLRTRHARVDWSRRVVRIVYDRNLDVWGWLIASVGFGLLAESRGLAAFAAATAVIICGCERLQRTLAQLRANPWHRSKFPGTRSMEWYVGAAAMLASAAVLIGAIGERNAVILSGAADDESKTVALAQALFAAQVGAIALASGVIGLSLQSRASAFGGDLAAALVPTWPVAGVATFALGASTADGLLLARWSQAMGVRDGMLGDLAIVCSVAGIASTLILSWNIALRHSGHDAVATAMEKMVRSRRFHARLTEYGAKYPHPGHFPYPAEPPSEIRLFGLALAGARRQSDVVLFRRFVEAWDDGIDSYESFGYFRAKEPLNRFYEAIYWPFSTLTLTKDEANFFRGLDLATGSLIGTFQSYGDPGLTVLLSPTVAKIFPPFESIERHQDWDADWWDERTPGFVAVRELVEGLLRLGRLDAVASVIRFEVDRILSIGLIWAEAAGPDPRGTSSDLRLLDRWHNPIDWLIGVAATARRAGDASEVVDAIFHVLIRAIEHADMPENRNRLLFGIDRLAPFGLEGTATAYRRLGELSASRGLPSHMMANIVCGELRTQFDIDVLDAWKKVARFNRDRAVEDRLVDAIVGVATRTAHRWQAPRRPGLRRELEFHDLFDVLGSVSVTGQRRFLRALRAWALSDKTERAWLLPMLTHLRKHAPRRPTGLMLRPGYIRSTTPR